MLQLKNITKHYDTGDILVKALNDVSLNFRQSEFVSVLGPSGCGKTTLLNIIGGLDRYTSGDIIINGTSTKDYKDKDWDSYRNHSVGFVFQSYNLIPHQSVLKNVELALTLSGIKREERRERAKRALEKVGLGDQLNKRPNQMSGGQMQRVAIARAIVNDPDIILADEPTGALDTETSVQVMQILKELSETKLVIMVTHNPELANEYSTRIINLKDGKVQGDTMPLEFQEEKPDPKKKKEKKPSMSFWTALSLSLNNLATKKGRTLLTSFAGSIGIIGIALILSLSAGFNGYINNVQKNTLTSYPISIQQTNISVSAIAETFLGGTEREGEKYPEEEIITTQNSLTQMVNSLSGSASMNDLSSFKTHLEQNLDENLYTAIKYSYNVDFKVFREQTYSTAVLPERKEFVQVHPVALPPAEMLVMPQIAVQLDKYYKQFAELLTSQSAWGEITGTKELVDSQYDYLYGNYPKNFNEILLVVDEYNQISDLSLYMLGLLTPEDISYLFTEMVYANFMPEEHIPGDTTMSSINDLYQMLTQKNNVNELTKQEKVKEILKAQGLERSKMTFTFKEIAETDYKAVVGSELYEETGSVKLTESSSEKATKTFSKLQGDKLSSYLSDCYNVGDTSGKNTKATQLKISGIVRLKENVTGGSINGSIGYTKELTEMLIDKNNAQPLVMEYVAEEQKATERAEVLGNTANCYVNLYTGEACSSVDFLSLRAGAEEETSLEILDLESPSAISIYAKSFEDKDAIVDFISEYNNGKPEDKQIKYNDLIGMMMSSVTTIINAITYVLIAFVSISLIVSSIMIGIITYISVLERTKEIGVLRSIGASKRDVGRVFNAETVIIGFASGALGILITILLNIPINFVIHALTGISGVASLPVVGAIALIAISVLLTTIAGLFPASIASKKDPVVALRTE